MGVRVATGQAKGRSLKSLPGSRIRPTTDLVRGALLSILSPYLEGTHVLDLFAGTGALGIEALSRGAARADFVESHPRQCAALRVDLQELGFRERSAVWCARVESAISSLPGPYQLILLDPPYAYQRMDELLQRVALSTLVEEGSILAVEHSRRRPLPEAVGAMTLLKRRTYGDTAISIYRQTREA